MSTTPTTRPSTGSSAATPAVNRTQTNVDPQVPVHVRLSLLWVGVLLVFAYVDLFGFFRADVLEGALDGEVAVAGLQVGQGLLLGALGYVLPAILMVAASLSLPRRVLRTTTLVLAPLYAVSIAALCVGESRLYYLVASAVEVMLLVIITRTAWQWGAAARPGRG